MFGRRNATKDIFRAVVLGGAMLGMTACGGGEKKVEEPTKDDTEKTNPCKTDTENPCKTDPKTDDTEKKNPCQPETKHPCDKTENPCAKRNPCDNGPRGRGFILA